jgi:hypothetical protein
MLDDKDVGAWMRYEIARVLGHEGQANEAANILLALAWDIDTDAGMRCAADSSRKDP